jgi:hypothetical protein
MTDKALIGAIVAQTAHDYAAPKLVNSDALPEIQNFRAAEAAINQVVTQSAPIQSERIWAALFAGLTAVLATPEVQAILGPWAPVATALVSAGLAAWSKFSDQRPMR